MRTHYPNTPTAAERKRHRVHQLTQAAAAVLLTAAAVYLLTITLIIFN